MSPDLSIVIVNWNVRDLLRRCLTSVQASIVSVDSAPLTDAVALLHVETIVIDNASTDDSADMLRTEFPEAILLANAENRGFAAGNNQGIEIARGRYILLLNPDTEVLGNSLASLVRYADSFPEVGLVGPQLLNPNGGVQSSRRRFPTRTTLFLESTWLEFLAPRSLLAHYYAHDAHDDAIVDVDWVTGAAMLVRREAIQQVGGFDEGFFMYSEELDWCRRIKASGWRVVYYPSAQIVHHVGKSSEQAVASRHTFFQRSRVRYARKYHSRLVATILRLYLLGLYAWQFGLELFKGVLGHKRALRWQRAGAYWRVLKSGL